MKYTVYLELNFDDKKDANKIMDLVKTITNKVYKQTGTEPIEMVTKCELWETHHDETPPKQCKQIEVIKFNEGVTL